MTEVETVEAKEITPAEAQAVLEEQKRKRIQQCQHEINEALRRHKCDLIGEPFFTPDGRIRARVRLVDASRPGQVRGEGSGA